MTDVEKIVGAVKRRRILFVDDEPNVLEGIQNLLHKQRRRWEMIFVLGGQAALDQLGTRTFDVIVSDMQMPGMDGATLLQKVKEEHPRIARFVLSGHAERSAVMRALPVAHQFLSKPCDAEVLRVAIERVCELQDLLSNESVRVVVGQLDKLPSVPQTYWELKRAVGAPDCGINELTGIVGKDPAICVKILQLVNSAYFGRPQRISSISQAVAYLGIEVLKGLVLTAHVFSAVENAGIEGFSLEELQRGSMLTARVGKLLVKDPKCAEEAFTAGLVHDIGKIVLALGLPEKYEQVVRTAHSDERAFHMIEKELLGVTHAEIGAYLLGVWGLPLAIVEAVAYHHCPNAIAHESVEVLASVHVAAALVERPPNIVDGDGEVDIAFLERIGLTGELPRWRAIAEKESRSLDSQSQRMGMA